MAKLKSFFTNWWTVSILIVVLLLLVFGPLGRADLQRLKTLTGGAPLRAVQVPAGRERAQATEHVRDPDGHLRAACQLAGPGWALVRPDGYLAANGDRIDGRLVAALERSLGLR